MPSRSILAIDSSTRALCLALGLTNRGSTDPEAQFIVERPERMAKHGRLMIARINELFEAAGQSPKNLGTVAVGIGPGSYTGLRIGLMAAKCLAYTLQIPIVLLDSLEVIAYTAMLDHTNRVDLQRDLAVVSDAQRGDLYVARFRIEESGHLRRLEPTRRTVGSPWLDDLSEGTQVIGPDLDRLDFSWSDRTPRLEVWPDGRGLLDLAVRSTRFAGRSPDPEIWAAEPLYLRLSAAEEKRADQGISEESATSTSTSGLHGPDDGLGRPS